MSSVPTLTLSTPNPVILNDNITITGTIDAADVNVPISVYDGEMFLGTANTKANGTWSFQVALPVASTYSLTAQATNATGTGTSAAIVLDAFSFTQADLNVADNLTSDIDAASPSAIETVSSAGPTTISSSASYVVDTATVNNTIDASSQDVITGDGGTTINLSGLSASIYASGPTVLIALASGASAIAGSSFSNIVNINESITAVIDGDASTSVVDVTGSSVIDLAGSGGTVEIVAPKTTIAALSGIYNVFSPDGGSLLFLGNSGTYNIDNGATSTSVFGGAGSYFDLSAASGDNPQVDAVAGGGAETFNAANDAVGVNFFGGSGSADFIGGAGENSFTAGTGDEVMVGGSGSNIFAFSPANYGFAEPIFTIQNFASHDYLYFTSNSYDIGAYALKYQEVVDGDLILPLGDGAEIVIVGKTTPLSASQVMDSSSNGTPPAAPTIVAPPTPLSVTGAAVAAIDGNSSHTTGTVTASDAVTLAFTFSADAFITGNPTLQLNDGGVATYVSGSGGTKLTFSYSPARGQNVSTLASTGLVNGAVQDAYGNAASGFAQTFNGLSVETPCYCRGTLIATDQGDVAVENLRIGDLLITASGGTRPIRWIGTRSYAGRFANANPAILPICFKTGSLGESMPRRDLRVSPKHAMFLDGVLIAAEHLVNGASIVQAEQVDLLEYFHVELDSHDVIVAEGALSETFVDDDSRGMFHNAHAFGALYPEAARVEARYCAARVDDGFALEAVRRRLKTLAGLETPSPSGGGTLRGCVERIEANRVSGWAQSAGYPDAPVCLDLVVDDTVVAQVLADRYRPDLQREGVGDGSHGFEVPLPGTLSDTDRRKIAVHRSADGAVLPVREAPPTACSSGALQAA